jgi:hypothetical protein
MFAADKAAALAAGNAAASAKARADAEALAAAVAAREKSDKAGSSGGNGSSSSGSGSSSQAGAHHQPANSGSSGAVQWLDEPGKPLLRFYNVSKGRAGLKREKHLRLRVGQAVSIHRVDKESGETPVAGYGLVLRRCAAAVPHGGQLVDVEVAAPGFVSDDGVRFGPGAQEKVMSCHPSFLLPKVD